jgi:hypothetical protein
MKNTANAIRRQCGAIRLSIVVALVSVFSAQAASNASKAIVVDTRSGCIRTVSPCDIQYSPGWCGVDEPGSYVVIERVEHADMANAVTSTVAVLTADAEGDYNYALSADEARSARFIHRVLNADGNEIGERLVRDVGFGVVSTAPSDSIVADCRANSLSEAVADGNTVNLTYSSGWAVNAASVAIKSIQLSGKGGAPVATNDIFDAEAPTQGSTSICGCGLGWLRLLYQITDSSGDVLLEYVTDEFRLNGGFFIIVR